MRSYALECSEVKVKVTRNKTTPVKYRYLKNVLKYSNEVVLLRYWRPLVVGAMCSSVYCLSPPILLPHYCFSGSTCVPLFCLPIYLPGVCSPVLIRCLSSCVYYVDCYSSLPACLFSPSRWFCSFLFHFMMKREPFSCTWVLASSLFSCTLTQSLNNYLGESCI